MSEITLAHRIKLLREQAPTGLTPFIVAVLCTQFLLVAFIPPSDFDTMSSYLARIYLEQFGPLRQTATLEIQYLFPKFFDYLHAPLLSIGAFYSLPNFGLFIAVLYIIVARFETRMAVIAIGLLFAAQPIAVTVTGVKNDVSIGLIGFIGWFLICRRPPSPLYLATSILSLCALVGTKWHARLWVSDAEA